MPTHNASNDGQLILKIDGDAWVIDQSGQVEMLHVGSVISREEIVTLAPDTIMQVQLPDGLIESINDEFSRPQKISNEAAEPHFTHFKEIQDSHTSSALDNSLTSNVGHDVLDSLLVYNTSQYIHI